MALLIQFLLRICFGMAFAMATVSARKVSSGYFRNHLYVILGLSALASLLSRAVAPGAFAWTVATAVASYLGSVAWLYEKRKPGVALLMIVAGLALIGLLNVVQTDVVLSQPVESANLQAATALRYLQTATSGFVLGFTMAGMLLGHWYLNAPGMELVPLKTLLMAMGIAVAAHAVICGLGLWLEVNSHGLDSQEWLFVALRWSFGLAGVLILTWLAWRTLEVPNTQSATGILYVAVIGTFVGETMSLLLSAETIYPV
jgi:hypothetical protein